MANGNLDRDTLRELTDEGNEMALGRLADLADARDDVQELSDLLDEGCLRAGRLLTRRAEAFGDLASCNSCGTPVPRTPARR
jgi:hypothetical protein